MCKSVNVTNRMKIWKCQWLPQYADIFLGAGYVTTSKNFRKWSSHSKMLSKAINSIFEIGPSFPKGIFGHKKRPLRGKVINTKLAVSLYFLLGPLDDPTMFEQHYHFSNVMKIHFCCCCEKHWKIMCKECCEWILSCMNLSDEQQSTQT